MYHIYILKLLYLSVLFYCFSSIHIFSCSVHGNYSPFWGGICSAGEGGQYYLAISILFVYSYYLTFMPSFPFAAAACLGLNNKQQPNMTLYLLLYYHYS